MNQLYYRDLRKRVEALEAKFSPEPEPEVICVTDADDGLPLWIAFLGRGYWERRTSVPIPPEILEYARPEARAAYETQAQEAQQREAARRAPPPSEPPTPTRQD
jgi:hypothetical protein